MKLAIILILIFLTACTTEVCNEKITCENGKVYPAESYNQETKQCEPLFYTGGTPCFNEKNEID